MSRPEQEAAQLRSVVSLPTIPNNALAMLEEDDDSLPQSKSLVDNLTAKHLHVPGHPRGRRRSSIVQFQRRLSHMASVKLGMALTMTVEMVMEKEENAVCADCNAPHPTWASVNVGCLICTQCAGVHRSLGTHVSFVLSCVLDKWEPEQIKRVAERGNEEVNAELEFHVPTSFFKPVADEGREERQRYIEAKYRDRLFAEDKAPAAANGQRTRMPPRPRPHTSKLAAEKRGRSRAFSSAPVMFGKAAKRASRLNHSAAQVQQAMVLYDGMLMVCIKQGRDLHCKRKQTSNTQVYCKARVGGQKVRSRTIKDGANPNWDETLLVCFSSGESLVLSVWEKDLKYGIADHHIGTAVICAKELPEEAVSLCVPLHSRRNTAPVSWRELAESAAGAREGLGPEAQALAASLPDAHDHRRRNTLVAGLKRVRVLVSRPDLRGEIDVSIKRMNLLS